MHDLKSDSGRGTKQLVSVNICAVEGNSAGILVTGSKMNAYYFWRDKTAILGAIEAQLPFSEGKHQLLNLWNKLLFPRVSII